MRKRQAVKCGLGFVVTMSFLLVLQPWIVSDLMGSVGNTQLTMSEQSAAVPHQQIRADDIVSASHHTDDIVSANHHTEDIVSASHYTEDRDAAAHSEMVRQRFEQRRQRLQQACRMYGNSSLIRHNKPTSYVPMPLYRPHINASVHYCAIAKTACTTWTAFFAAIRNYMTAHNVTPSEEWSTASDSIHFTFVREPYARLLSGYVDKLLTPNEVFWRITGKHVVHNFRRNASSRSLACGHDVTFPEFVKYVIHSQETGQYRNDHFIPTHDHCNLCGVPYRYIGFLETMAEDMPFITKAMGSPISYTRSYDSDTIRQNAQMVFWKKRLEAMLKCMDRDEASRRLWKKYQIRGLISKHEQFPFPPGKAINLSVEEFIDKALEAHERSKTDPNIKAQRTESLREAFAQVPLEDRLRLQQTLFLDFQMFGFDPFLEDVFPKEPYVRDKHFSYFSIY